jgi:hypothetical protein
VVDEGQQIAQERQARRAAIGDVGEESNSEASISNSSDSDSEDSQDDSLSDGLDDIVEDIEGWKADARGQPSSHSLVRFTTLFLLLRLAYFGNI